MYRNIAILIVLPGHWCFWHPHQIYITSKYWNMWIRYCSDYIWRPTIGY